LQIFDAEEASLVASIAEGSDEEPSLLGFVVRLRGLPFSSTAEDVLNFCHPVILMGASSGVLFSCNQDGRFTGDVFLELDTEEDLELCLQKNRKLLGSRFIETSRSTKGELFHIAHHRGFFTLVAGVKKYHGLNVIDQYSGEVAGKLPRIQTKPPHLDNYNLNRAFTGLGFSQRTPYLQHQHMQQRYYAGAAGSFTQLNHPIGAMAQPSVMQMGISQHHNPADWPAVPTNRAWPPSSAFSPGQQQHQQQQQQQQPQWDYRRQSTDFYTNTPSQAQQQSMLTAPFAVHPFMTAAAPQTTTWGPPAAATYATMPQQDHHQQLQQRQAAAATARYGGAQVVFPAGDVGAMSWQYPGLGYTTDGRRQYPMQQQQQQGSFQPSPRYNYQSYQQQQQYFHRNRGGAHSTSRSSGGHSQLAQPAPNTNTASRSTSVTTSPPPQPKETPLKAPSFGNEKLIVGQGIPSQSSSADSANSHGEKDGSSDARSSSPPR